MAKTMRTNIKLENPRDIARFESKFIFNDDTNCWDWIAAFRISPHTGIYTPSFYLTMPASARRIAFEYYEGPLPIGVQLFAPICGSSKCINPDHSNPQRLGPGVGAGNHRMNYRYDPAICCINGHLKRIYGKPNHRNGKVLYCTACNLARIRNARKASSHRRKKSLTKLSWQERAVAYLNQ